MPSLTFNAHVIFWGDVREIGCRHSTFLTMLVLNHELHLREISYRNPYENDPVGIFYESDSRDNLETNIEGNNFIEQMQIQMPQNKYSIWETNTMFLPFFNGS